MEIEKLTKQQIVLLTLLVSFVTSIATGIVTVSLMEQAPPAVTQTINRVVERTVEKVVPADVSQGKGVTKETVVVREEDLAVAAIEKNAKSIVRIHEISGTGALAIDRFATLGIVIARDGTILTDSAMLLRDTDDAGNAIPEIYIGYFADGKSSPLELLGADSKTRIALFRPQKDPKATTPPRFEPASLGNSDDIKLGQTVIAIGGEKTNEIATGVVSSVIPFEDDAASASTTPKVSPVKVGYIKTNIDYGSVVPGSILFTLSGDIAGIKNSGSSLARNTFTAANLANRALQLFAFVPDTSSSTNTAQVINASASKRAP